MAGPAARTQVLLAAIRLPQAAEIARERERDSERERKGCQIAWHIHPKSEKELCRDPPWHPAEDGGVEPTNGLFSFDLQAFGSVWGVARFCPHWECLWSLLDRFFSMFGVPPASQDDFRGSTQQSGFRKGESPISSTLIQSQTNPNQGELTPEHPKIEPRSALKLSTKYKPLPKTCPTPNLNHPDQPLNSK